MQVPLSWERLLWSGRPLGWPGTRYVLTDLRLVRLSRTSCAELIVQEFGHIAKRVSEADVEEGFIGAKDTDENLKPRAPVVTRPGVASTVIRRLTLLSVTSYTCTV